MVRVVSMLRKALSHSFCARATGLSHSPLASKLALMASVSMRAHVASCWRDCVASGPSAQLLAARSSVRLEACTWRRLVARRGRLAAGSCAWAASSAPSWMKLAKSLLNLWAEWGSWWPPEMGDCYLKKGKINYQCSDVKT